jgi:tRNA(Ser,Leu) C12 N-acetylase TAN1
VYSKKQIKNAISNSISVNFPGYINMVGSRAGITVLKDNFHEFIAEPDRLYNCH